MTSRKGMDLMMNAIRAVIIIAIVVSVGLEIDKFRQRENARIDAGRLHRATLILDGEGTAAMELSFNNEYEEVSIQQGTIEITADFLEDPLTLELPGPYEYTGAVDTGTACMYKRGMSYVLVEGPCTEQTCTEQVCSILETPPEKGFYCQNGVYTNEGFFKHYYSSTAAGCGQKSEDFAVINKFTCPRRAAAETAIDCVIAATWRCTGSDGEAQLRLDGGVVERHTLSCDAELHHARFATELTPSPGSYEVAGILTSDAWPAATQRTTSLEVIE